MGEIVFWMHRCENPLEEKPLCWRCVWKVGKIIIYAKMKKI